MTSAIDTHLGKRVRRRRRLLGQTQKDLGTSVGVRFQQIQKYELGANRISAARIYEIAKALEVPVGYFYEGLEGVLDSEPGSESSDLMGRAETLDLVRTYYQLGERPRRRLLDLAKSMNDEAPG